MTFWLKDPSVPIETHLNTRNDCHRAQLRINGSIFKASLPFSVCLSLTHTLRIVGSKGIMPFFFPWVSLVFSLHAFFLTFIGTFYASSVWGLPRWHNAKESACQCRRYKRMQFQSLGQEDPLEKEWQPTPVFLLGQSHGLRSLAGYSPQGCVLRHNWGHASSNQEILLVICPFPSTLLHAKDRMENRTCSVSAPGDHRIRWSR